MTRLIATGLGALALTLLSTSRAFAVGELEAAPTAKGITGGALLGAEVVLLTEAALKVKPAWAYIVGGAVGAAGGGVGGYFIEDSVEPRISFIMLTAGMALVIPTSIAVMAATAYEPPADATQDTGPADEPVADPATVRASRSEGEKSRAVGRHQTRQWVDHSSSQRSSFQHQGALLRAVILQPPPALVGVSVDRLAVNVPAVEVTNVYNRLEQQLWGVAPGTELRIPVLSYTF